MKLFSILFIPFLGTLLGSATVFFLKKEINDKLQKLLLGFASGVMVAASVWSLLIPSIEESESMGKLAWMPAALGIALGMAFLFLLDMIIPHLHPASSTPDGRPNSRLKKTTMLVLAVTLHNIPEGMAVGVVAAGFLNPTGDINFQSALALALGIAIQNFPEGSIISLPLKSSGGSKGKAFLYGTLSGIVEPIAAILTILLSQLITNLLPYFLSFAAGAMLFVVVEELIPEASSGSHSNNGTLGFGAGFIIMMILDVMLG
jgi:ZIP family zinc transporter